MKTTYIEAFSYQSVGELRAKLKYLHSKYSSYDFSNISLLIECRRLIYQITKEHMFNVTVLNKVSHGGTFYRIEKPFYDTLEEAIDEIIRLENELIDHENALR